MSYLKQLHKPIIITENPSEIKEIYVTHIPSLYIDKFKVVNFFYHKNNNQIKDFSLEYFDKNNIKRRIVFSLLKRNNSYSYQVKNKYHLNYNDAVKKIINHYKRHKSIPTNKEKWQYFLNNYPEEFI